MIFLIFALLPFANGSPFSKQKKAVNDVKAFERQPQLLELGCALLRLPVFSRLATHVFFGRGSFPDVSDKHLQSLTNQSAQLG